MSFCSRGVADVSFAPGGISICSDNYISHLENHVLPKYLVVFPEGKFRWQEDGASPHTANATTEWQRDNFKENLLSKIRPWPAKSPDLSPNDFWLWGEANRRLDKLPAPDSIPALKACILEIFRGIGPEECKKAVAQWVRRLEICKEMKGERFEYKM